MRKSKRLPQRTASFVTVVHDLRIVPYTGFYRIVPVSKFFIFRKQLYKHNTWIMQYRLFLFLAIVLLTTACRKAAPGTADVIQDPEVSTVPDEEKILGAWLKHPLLSTPHPADTLYFSQKNNVYTLSFDCSGSPGYGWPSHAEIPYKFQNGKLSYLTYFDPSLGYYIANSFKWVIPGKQFDVFLNEVLLYMSATYYVRYTKIE